MFSETDDREHPQHRYCPMDGMSPNTAEIESPFNRQQPAVGHKAATHNVAVDEFPYFMNPVFKVSACKMSGGGVWCKRSGAVAP